MAPGYSKPHSPPPPRRDRERHPRPQVRRRAEPSPLGPLRRQRCLADGAGHRPQSGPLDWAYRSGRAGGNHQDSLTTLLLPDRAAHPLGTPPHFASSPRLALGKPVRQRSGPIARPAAPLMTTPTASDHPPHYPIAWPTRARLAPQCLLLPPARLLSPSAGVRAVNIPLAWLQHPVPSWIGAGQGHAAAIRLLSSLASPGWPDPFGGSGLRAYPNNPAALRAVRAQAK